jgi:hypothetical protein
MEPIKQNGTPRYHAEDLLTAEEDLHEIPTTTLMKEFLDQARVVVRSEIDIAKSDLRVNVRHVSRAATFGAGAALLGAVAFLLFTAFLVLAISELVVPWAATLIVFALYAGGAALLFITARARLTKLDSRRTRQHFQEEKQWLQEILQTIRGSRASA